MKMINSSIYKYCEKKYWNLCQYWLYFFPVWCVCVKIYFSKWLLKGISNHGYRGVIFFSDPDISALFWISNSILPPMLSVFSMLSVFFTRQLFYNTLLLILLLSLVSSLLSSLLLSSSSLPLLFNLKFGFFDIYFLST